jgi:hypothetical protein
MDITTTTLGFASVGAVAAIAIVLAWPRRRVTTHRFLGRPPFPRRPGSRSLTDWFAGDPVLFTGGDAGSADCSAGSDGGGGGGCD